MFSHTSIYVTVNSPTANIPGDASASVQGYHVLAISLKLHGAKFRIDQTYESWSDPLISYKRAHDLGIAELIFRNHKNLPMYFERQWDSTCPRVWDQWEVEGTRYVIQDLRPEDDDLAVQLLVEGFLADEPMCSESGALNDSISVRSWTDLWSQTLLRRTSLACYVEKDCDKLLVAVNCCFVLGSEEKLDVKMKGDAFINMMNSLIYVRKKVDCFKYLETDKSLRGLGLAVKKEFRNTKIGTRILDAREPFCRAYGIKGTSTLFTSIGAQKCAERAGFTTLVETTWKELADAGFKYPSDEKKLVKLMVKKYN